MGPRLRLYQQAASLAPTQALASQIASSNATTCSWRLPTPEFFDDEIRNRMGFAG
jgi:hypothetical protein